MGLIVNTIGLKKDAMGLVKSMNGANIPAFLGKSMGLIQVYLSVFSNRKGQYC